MSRRFPGTRFAAPARMDHRWDEVLERERAARAERERYGERSIEDDPDVVRRDRGRELERLRRRSSAWEIGAAHWNQRDLYTRNARIDDEGYGLGPRFHPPQGSYAYPRDPLPARPSEPSHLDAPSRERLYRREAWPIEYYDEKAGVAPLHERDRSSTSPAWHRFAQRLVSAVGLGSRTSPRSDARLLEDVCEALASRGDVDATDIEVKVDEAEVTLTGTVPDRRMKRTAEDVAAACPGVRHVHNRLRVEDEGFPWLGAPVRAY